MVVLLQATGLFFDKALSPLKPIKLLHQNLDIEHNMQNFIVFVLESMNTFGGNVFAAFIAGWRQSTTEDRRRGAA